MLAVPSRRWSLPFSVFRKAPAFSPVRRLSIVQAGGVRVRSAATLPSCVPSYSVKRAGANDSREPSRVNGDSSCWSRSGSTITSGARTVPVPDNAAEARSIRTVAATAAGAARRSTSGRSAPISARNAGRSSSVIASAESSEIDGLRRNTGLAQDRRAPDAPPDRRKAHDVGVARQLGVQRVDGSSLRDTAVAAALEDPHASIRDTHALHDKAGVTLVGRGRHGGGQQPASVVVAQHRHVEPRQRDVVDDHVAGEQRTQPRMDTDAAHAEGRRRHAGLADHDVGAGDGHARRDREAQAADRHRLAERARQPCLDRRAQFVLEQRLADEQEPARECHDERREKNQQPSHLLIMWRV